MRLQVSGFLLGLAACLVLGNRNMADAQSPPHWDTLPASQQPSTPDYFHRQKKIYRWHDQTKLVLVYISAAHYLPDWGPGHAQAVQAAFAEWQRALDNRLIFVFMKDPANVDVVVSWWDHASPQFEQGACGLNMSETWGRYIAKNDIYISLHNPQGQTWQPTQIYATALHEIGHMIGIKEHSDDPRDVMASATATDHLTARDIATARKIYAHKAHYTNPPGVRLSNFEAFKKTQKGRGWSIPIPIPIPL